jgi:regulatory protein
MPRSRAKHPLDVHERALRLLAVRARSRRELERRLLDAGFEVDEVADELGRLESVGLVDDETFARQVAEHELRTRRVGSRSVAGRLAAKGVDRGTIERALAEVPAAPEEERALELARARARRLRGLSTEAAYGRLVPFLLRRGFDGSVARTAAAKAVEVDAAEPDLA